MLGKICILASLNTETMDINSLKLSVVQKVVDSNNEPILVQIEKLLSNPNDPNLSDEQLNVLNERRNRYFTEEKETGYSWEEVKEIARDAVKRPK